jgi:regulator of protease activity HflC (stomatin/prohibitin superfamily)
MDTEEKTTKTLSGWMMLGILIAAGVFLAWAFISNVTAGEVNFSIAKLFMTIPSLLVWAVFLRGFFTLQPNEAAVLILFGKYRGTEKASGFRWANPFFTREKISLRSRNLNGDPIKVNDSRGNPIEIAAVVVWKVQDTAHAVFDVDRYTDYVSVQSESALRHLAMRYPYDAFEGDTMSLQGSTDEVSDALEKEIQERVAKAGILIEEARLSHLAYAQEIASAMLQRQQADAIVAARSRIVEGAVGMVEMALDKLEAGGKIDLDEERKAAMVSNLLVVLCSHENPQPVLNTGTLYS